jgi:hypothetical protein
MSKQQTETKEWTNIDFTNTSAYRTVEAFRKEGITWSALDGGPNGEPGIPDDEWGQLKRLRYLDGVAKPDKGPITKEIQALSRFIVRQLDKGKMVAKEVITVQSQIKCYDWSGIQLSQTVLEGFLQKTNDW